MNAPFAPGSVSLRLYPHGDLPATADRRRARAQAALAATSRVRRRDDERAPRRLPRLPAQPVASRGLVPRGHATRLGRARARCCCRCARPRWWRRRSRGWRRASPAASGSASRRARCPPTSRSCTCRWTTSRRASPPRSRSSPASSTAARRAPSRRPRDRRAATEHPVPGAQRGDGLHRSAARRPPRRRTPLRLDVDARTLPRAGRRVPRGRRHRAVRARAPGVGRRAAPPRLRGPARGVPRLLVAAAAQAQLGRAGDGRLDRPRRRRRRAPRRARPLGRATP